MLLTTEGEMLDIVNPWVWRKEGYFLMNGKNFLLSDHGIQKFVDGTELRVLDVHAKLQARTPFCSYERYVKNLVTYSSFWNRIQVFTPNNKTIHFLCKPSVKRISSLVIVRSSPGVAVLLVRALTPISTARPTVPLVEYQYRISSGMTWIKETRGSLASPLWTPSFKSPNHADVLKVN